MRPLTANQTALLDNIRLQFANRKARGVIPAWAIECYDWRSFQGLLDRGLIVRSFDADHAGRYRLADKWERAPKHDKRIQHGDDWAGDAWRNSATKEIRWTVVGQKL